MSHGQQTEYLSVDSDSEYSYEEEPYEQEISDDRMGCQAMFQNPFSTKGEWNMFEVDASMFVMYVKPWDHQRKLRDEHVDYLTKVLENGDAMIDWFKICVLDGDYFLIDGQHRQRAMKRYLSNQPPPFTIFAMVKQVASDSEIRKEFRKANTLLPMKLAELPEEKSVGVIDMIKKQYKGVFRHLKDGGTRVNRPYFHEKDFANAICVNKYVSIQNYSARQIFDAIIKYNCECMDLKYGISVAQRAKAMQMKFYVGLDKNWKENLLKHLV